MPAFETAAVLDDASHLTLRVPVPEASGRECRVIVFFEHTETPPAAWPPGFFEDIKIMDPAFTRPEQGQVPPVAALNRV